jgi:hypothetical protein
MEPLVEGLKMALAKGHSIEAAKASFKNAGYSSEEVDAAARAVQIPDFQPRKPAPTLKEDIPKPSEPKVPTPKEKMNHEVSGYGEKPKMKSKLGWIILIVGALIILGGVITAFIFKTELSSFFSRLFP